MNEQNETEGCKIRSRLSKTNDTFSKPGYKRYLKISNAEVQIDMDKVAPPSIHVFQTDSIKANNLEGGISKLRNRDISEKILNDRIVRKTILSKGRKAQTGQEAEL